MREKSELAGQTVKVRPKRDLENLTEGAEFRVEDWWENVYGQSWMTSDGNPAAMLYGMRTGIAQLPMDNEVLYGKIGALGYLVHMSEIEQVPVS